MITHRAWGAPKNKRSKLKSSDKTKRYFENTPPWTEPLKADRHGCGPVFLSPRVVQIIGFGKVAALNMLQHLFSSYGVIDEIDLVEKAVKMMGT